MSYVTPAYVPFGITEAEVEPRRELLLQLRQHLVIRNQLRGDLDGAREDRAVTLLSAGRRSRRTRRSFRSLERIEPTR
mgnify:CR=1 FL=1